MTTEQHLEKALSFAKYQETLNQQRRLLKEQFEADTLLAHAGGLFRISQEWLGGFDIDNKWVLDLNGTPVQVEDSAALLSAAKTAYRTALGQYGEQYQLLRRQRSVRSLVGL
jgi:hypothetical protein